MAIAPQPNDSSYNLLAKIAVNSGTTQPAVGDGEHNLLWKIAANTYSAAVSGISAFKYIGSVSGGADAGSATDLSTLTEKNTGDYYSVTSAGYFVLAPAAPFYANKNDGLVFNTTGGVDLFDNTDSSISGTTDYIDATALVGGGHVIDIDSAFKTRVSNVESKTQNINLATTVSGTTNLTGNLTGDGSSALSGFVIDGGTF